MAREENFTKLIFKCYLTLNGAVRHVDEEMGGTTIDYSSLSAQETKIMDVFEHKEQDTKNKVK